MAVLEFTQDGSQLSDRGSRWSGGGSRFRSLYGGQSSYGPAPPPTPVFLRITLPKHALLAPCSGEADLLAPCYTPFSGFASKKVSHKVET